MPAVTFLLIRLVFYSLNLAFPKLHNPLAWWVMSIQCLWKVSRRSWALLWHYGWLLPPKISTFVHLLCIYTSISEYQQISKWKLQNLIIVFTYTTQHPLDNRLYNLNISEATCLWREREKKKMHHIIDFKNSFHGFKIFPNLT